MPIITRTHSRREVQVHLTLDEPADVDMLPMPMRWEPDQHGGYINPDPVVRAVVTLRTEDGQPLPPLLTLATARGRYLHAGVGQNPDERDDTLLQRFAHLIDAARAHVTTVTPAGTRFDGQLIPQATYGVPDQPFAAPVRHLGTTDTPALHVCRHNFMHHPCDCNLGADHQHGQDGATCTLDETDRV